MTTTDLVKMIIQCEQIVVEDLYTDKFVNGEEILVARVRLQDDDNYRCPICGEKGDKHGCKQGRLKRWRALDWGKERFYIESELPRVRCATCGVHAQKMPWALHNSDYTYAFDLRAACMSASSPANFVARQMRIQQSLGNYGRPASLPAKIAIDETS